MVMDCVIGYCRRVEIQSHRQQLPHLPRCFLAYAARNITLRRISARILRRKPLWPILFARNSTLRADAHTPRACVLVHRPIANPLFRHNAEHV